MINSEWPGCCFRLLRHSNNHFSNTAAMSPSALVTGASGLLGRQVLKAFEKAGYKTTGTGYSRASPPKILKVDIQDADEVEKLLDEVK